MTQSRILEKIKKCLALAASANPNEAEIAWRQAMKLMEAHKLSLSQVQASSAETATSHAGRRPSTWLISLAQTCAKAFCCELIILRSTRGSEVQFIGVGNSAEFCEYAFMALRHQLILARKNYVSTLTRCKLSTKRRRGDIFAESWIYAVYKTVAKFADMDGQTKAIISAYIETHLPNTTTTQLEAKKITGKDRTAAYAGYQSGTGAKLHKAMQRDGNAQIQHQLI